MVGRPPLPIGAHGKIGPDPTGARRISPNGVKPPVWLARCRFRDADGVTRSVERTGQSKSGAENALRAALAQRRHTAGPGLSGESRVREAARLWLDLREGEVESGQLAPTTLGVYRSVWRNHVAPALGELRLREMTVARCERWQQALRRAEGASVAKSARSVLSGVLGYAARLGAIPTNPTRDLSVIRGGARRKPRSMTRDERTAWLDGMEHEQAVVDELRRAEAAGAADDEQAALQRRLRVMRKAQRWELPDLSRFMLATGCRLGEALAVSWDEVDLSVGTVAVRWHLVRVTGEGLRRQVGAKSAAGDRVLRLPRWALDLLMRRQVEALAGTYPVFPDTARGWRDASNTGRVFREVRDELGFDWLTTHAFRRTTLTELDRAGLPAFEVSTVAGHSDRSMTERHYIERKVASESAAAALDGLLGPLG